MEYLSIKDLSAKFAMPERTVYYNVANNTNIRVKKEWRTKLANVADFAKACGKTLQPLQTVAEGKTKSQSDITVATLQKPLQDLQKKYEIVLSEKTNLERYNRNLEETAQAYALAIKDEKKEKLEWIGKYDTLQSKYQNDIQIYMKKYYFALWLCMVVLVILLLLNFLEMLDFIQKIKD